MHTSPSRIFGWAEWNRKHGRPDRTFGMTICTAVLKLLCIFMRVLTSPLWITPAAACFFESWKHSKNVFFSCWKIVVKDLWILVLANWNPLAGLLAHQDEVTAEQMLTVLMCESLRMYECLQLVWDPDTHWMSQVDINIKLDFGLAGTGPSACG